MINTVSLLHVPVSTTPVAIFREVSYKEYITKPQEPMHKCKIVGFQLYGLKYILK
jgi:hypothetical protein